jgi:hypothetical protein
MNPTAWLLVAVVILAGFCWLVAHYADDTAVVEAEPRATFDATELCHHTGCPREYQHDSLGWRECHLHYYERTEAAS